MSRELPLVFKVLNYINDIDNKLGEPINNYYYIAKYSMFNYYRYQDNNSIWRVIANYGHIYRFLFQIILYEMYLKIKMVFN